MGGFKYLNPQQLAWMDSHVPEEFGRLLPVPEPSFIENTDASPNPSVSYVNWATIPVWSFVAYQANPTYDPWLREKYKIRRSYNTGVSRTRRNLPAE
jgi:hypothetical protein